MKVTWLDDNLYSLHNPPTIKFACKHVCWDPKDGELCLRRVKPEETLVEARRDSDVQIDRHT